MYIWGSQVAETALADDEVRGGDRLALQRRVMRLGRPPRRWKRPPWATSLPCDPPEVCPNTGLSLVDTSCTC